MPGLSEGITSPVICVVSAAASRSMPAARCTLKPAQGAVAPISSIIGSDEFRRAVLEQVGGLQQQRAALAGAGLRPRNERPRRRLNDDGDIVETRGRRLARDLAGDRVVAGEKRTRGGADGRPVDQKIDLHHNLPRLWG